MTVSLYGLYSVFTDYQLLTSFTGAEIGFNPTVYSVDEGNGVVIVIENMTPHLERDVTVQFYTVGGSAVGMWHAWSIKPLVTNTYTILF